MWGGGGGQGKGVFQFMVFRIGAYPSNLDLPRGELSQAYVVLIHRLLIYQGSTQVLDSGPVYDSTIAGGRVVVFQFGTFPMIWTYLEVNCLMHMFFFFFFVFFFLFIDC